MSDEIWVNIIGYEGIYQVSNLGRIRSVTETKRTGKGHTGRILKQFKVKGYMKVHLSLNGIDKHKSVHRLVAEAFIENPCSLPQVNHKDENPENNRVDNLEWCDALYNVNYGTRTDRCRGELHGRAELTNSDVLYIRKHFKVRDREFGIKGLAKRFSVGQTTISHIVRGETWRHLL